MSPGAIGTSVGSFLAGARRSPRRPPAPNDVHRGLRPVRSTRSLRTISGTGSSSNEFIQREPANSGDPESWACSPPFGIVKGRRFAPDAPVRQILEEAVVDGPGHRPDTLRFDARPEEGFGLYPGSNWFNIAVRGRLPVPGRHPHSHARRRGAAATSEGARKLDSGHPSSMRRRGSHRRCACASPASDRST